MSIHDKLKASLRTAVLTAEGKDENLCVKYFKCLKGSSGPPQDYLRLTREGFLNSGSRRRRLDTLTLSRWLRLKVRLHKPSHKNALPQTHCQVKVKLPNESELPHPTFELQGGFGLPPVCTSDPLGRPSYTLCRLTAFQSPSVDEGSDPARGRRCTCRGRRRLLKEFL